MELLTFDIKTLEAILGCVDQAQVLLIKIKIKFFSQEWQTYWQANMHADINLKTLQEQSRLLKQQYVIYSSHGES